ncbi:MAG: hypothetical protein AAGG80_00955 [Pseudomonadota bacterium]
MAKENSFNPRLLLIFYNSLSISSLAGWLVFRSIAGTTNAEFSVQDAITAASSFAILGLLGEIVRHIANKKAKYEKLKNIISDFRIVLLTTATLTAFLDLIYKQYNDLSLLTRLILTVGSTGLLTSLKMLIRYAFNDASTTMPKNILYIAFNFVLAITKGFLGYILSLGILKEAEDLDIDTSSFLKDFSPWLVGGFAFVTNLKQLSNNQIPTFIKGNWKKLFSLYHIFSAFTNVLVGFTSWIAFWFFKIQLDLMQQFADNPEISHFDAFSLLVLTLMAVIPFTELLTHKTLHADGFIVKSLNLFSQTLKGLIFPLSAINPHTKVPTYFLIGFGSVGLLSGISTEIPKNFLKEHDSKFSNGFRIFYENLNKLLDSSVYVAFVFTLFQALLPIRITPAYYGIVAATVLFDFFAKEFLAERLILFKKNVFHFLHGIIGAAGFSHAAENVFDKLMEHYHGKDVIPESISIILIVTSVLVEAANEVYSSANENPKLNAIYTAIIVFYALAEIHLAQEPTEDEGYTETNEPSKWFLSNYLFLSFLLSLYSGVFKYFSSRNMLKNPEEYQMLEDNSKQYKISLNCIATTPAFFYKKMQEYFNKVKENISNCLTSKYGNVNS